MEPPHNKHYRYILFNKPYGVLSQFTRESGHVSLSDFGPFPKSVYTVGRLDADSEGLLLLTDDPVVTHHLTHPRYLHSKTYLVQVEGIPDELTIQVLQTGIVIEGKKTKPAGVKLLSQEPFLPPRPVPIRIRKNIPTSWLEIVLSEGRNRQIRKMTAGAGYPTLRIFRTHIGSLSIAGISPGEKRELSFSEIKKLFQNLNIHKYR